MPAFDGSATDIHHGLDANQVEHSRRTHGSNSFSPLPTKSVGDFVVETFADPMLRILMICAALALVVGLASGEWVEGVAIICAIAVVSAVGVRNQLKAQRDYTALDAQSSSVLVRVIRNGRIEEIKSSDIVQGDIVELHTGDVAPADTVLVSDRDILVDEKHVTGEPDASKNQDDTVFAGSRVLDGSGRAVVAVVGDSTLLGEIRSQLGADRGATPLEARLDDLAKRIGRAGVGAAVFTALALIIGAAFRGEWTHEGITTALEIGFNGETGKLVLFAVTAAFTIIVVAVPEGLPLAVTLALSYTTRRMAAESILVRELPACETMGAGTIICTDKTGTLTRGQMSLAHVWIGGELHDTDQIQASSLTGLTSIAKGFAVNSSADLAVEPDGSIRVIGNATEGGILQWLATSGTDYRIARESAVVVERREFTSSRKHMATLVEDSDGQEVHLKGAPEVLLGRCDRLATPTGIVALDHARRSDILETVKDYASRGFRTLATASGTVDAGQSLADADSGLVFAALFILADPIRAEVPGAVINCRRAGVEVMMITGDIVETAGEIGRQAGIVDDLANVMDASEFRDLSDDDIDVLLAGDSLKALARALPEDKERLVGLLQARGEVVGMTGDGVNDAPALKKADIGFAMGSGSQVAREAADVVIVDDNFVSTVSAIRWGRSVFENLRKFLQFQLTVNVVALVTAFTAAVFGFGTPLNAVQLLWVNLIMDSFAALALALEPPTDRLFDQRPHGRSEPLISKQMWTNVAVSSVAMLAVLLLVLFSSGLFGLASQEGIEATDRYRDSFLFNTFVWMQVFNAFNCRSVRAERSPFTNLRNSRSFLTIISIIAVSQVAIMFFGRAVFSVVNLGAADWAKSLVIGATMLLLGFVARAIGRLIAPGELAVAVGQTATLA
ncbi:MAG: calcium-translocating P-type ATPase, PMCA-type [Candidatus Microthrix sp.]|nr:calcium-translocating P-type ATPase, PMCA-type [Candidatus Microthrix sp.]MBK7018072.1 calcium-translocating P-type ATPase, PMCA-type [Candidatus Microthrix sp.]MBP9065607.1 calcium-translocating P-type ATPase, PMCA-type [Candidatus Microthrix sp.]